MRVTIGPVAEPSPVERLPPRVELSAEELSLLLGSERYQPSEPEVRNEVRPAPATEVPPESAVQPPTGAPRALGDADLVQAVLDGTADVAPLLLRVMRERTGEPLMRLVDGAAADAMVAAGTGTMVDAARALVAPLPPDARNAWAAWCSRWLRLAALVAQRAPKGTWDDPTGLPAWPRVRTHAAHRIAASRLRRESVHVAVIRLEDTDLWNRRAQILVNEPLEARAAAELDLHVGPGDELARLEDGAFVLVTSHDDAPQRLAEALRTMAVQLPADGPRSLAVRLGVASAPWDAVCPQALLETAIKRAAESRP